MNKGYLFILTTAFLFGTMETALKFFGSLFHPIQITVLRFFIGGFMLLPLARAALKKHGAVLTKKDYLFFAKAGFIGVFVSMIFYQLAVVYGKAAVSGVLLVATLFLWPCGPIFFSTRPLTAMSYHPLFSVPWVSFPSSILFTFVGLISASSSSCSPLSPLASTA